MILIIIFSSMLPLEESWKTFDTRHFNVFYYCNDTMAFFIGEIAESVYNELSEEYYPLKGKTDLVITDNLDYGNGYAMVFPFNTIVINLSSPEPGRIKHDWIYTVIKHEYSHVLSLSLSSVFWGFLTKFNVNGVFFPPNLLLPELFVEGFATGEEEENALFEGILRKQILEGDFPGIDRCLGSPEVMWPGMLTSYLYGYKFIKFLKERYGRKKLLDFYRLHSRLPLLNICLWKIFGKSKGTLWKEFRDYLLDVYGNEFQKINEKGVHEGQEVISHLSWVGGIKLKDGHIYYVEEKRPDGLPVLYRDSESLYTGMLKGPFTFVGDTIFFVQYCIEKNRYYYGDVYSLTVRNRKLKRKTYRLRVKYIEYIRPLDKFLLVIGNRGTDNLYLVDRKFRDFECLTQNKNNLVQYYQPSVSPDGRYIAMIVSKSGDFTDLYLFHMKSREFFRITSDPDVELHPSWSSDGKSVIFSKESQEIFNIYEFSLNDFKFYRLTNVIGGAFYPVYEDSNSILCAVIDKQGFSINRVKIKRNIVVFQWMKKNNVKTSIKIKNIKNYSALGNMSFASMVPFIEYSKREGLRYGIWGYFQDPLGYANLGLYFEPFFRKYHGLYLGSEYSYWKGPLWNVGIYAYWDVDYNRIGAFFSHVYLGNEKVVDFYTYYVFWVGIVYNKILEYMMEDFPIYSSYLNYTNLSIYYKNYKEYPKSISPEDGFAISAGTNYYFNFLDFRLFYPSFRRTTFAHRLLIGDYVFSDPFKFVRGIDQPSFLRKDFYRYNIALFYTLEYRFPLLYPERILLGSPLYLDRIYGKLFCDFGVGMNLSGYPFIVLIASNGCQILKLLGLPRFVGAEVSIDLKAFYNVPLTLRSGCAYSIFGEKYIFYLTLGNNF